MHLFLHFSLFRQLFFFDFSVGLQRIFSATSRNISFFNISYLRYSLTGAGIALAGKLEGVTETDSLTSISMTTDTRLQFPPNCSDRKTTCRTYDTSSNTNLEQDEFICIEVTEPQCSDKQMTTGNSRNFTEVKKREQKGEVEKVIR